VDTIGVDAAAILNFLRNFLRVALFSAVAMYASKSG
jgi:hypothetical protein